MAINKRLPYIEYGKDENGNDEIIYHLTTEHHNAIVKMMAQSKMNEAAMKAAGVAGIPFIKRTLFVDEKAAEELSLILKRIIKK